MGRPKGTTVIRTPANADSIVAWISSGQTLREWCRQNSVDASNVYRWMYEDNLFSQRFARAREEGFDQMAEDCIRLADECRIGLMEETDGEGKLTKVQRKDMIDRTKVQIETRMKLLAKWDPKRYGDKVQHADAHGNPLPSEIRVVGVIEAPKPKE